MVDCEIEKEFYVLANFQDVDSKNFGNANVEIIGIDKEEPIAEVSGNLFKGTHDFAMGTYIFAAKNTDVQPIAENTPFDNPFKDQYYYLGKTCKIVNFERVYVEEIKSPPSEGKVKNSDEVLSQDQDTSDEVNEESAEDDLHVALTYSEAKKLLGKSNINEKDAESSDPVN